MNLKSVNSGFFKTKMDQVMHVSSYKEFGQLKMINVWPLVQNLSPLLTKDNNRKLKVQIGEDTGCILGRNLLHGNLCICCSEA